MLCSSLTGLLLVLCLACTGYCARRFLAKRRTSSEHKAAAAHKAQHDLDLKVRSYEYIVRK